MTRDINPDDYIGYTEDEARELADERGVHIRVVKEDGRAHIITRDLRGDRVNVTLEDGIIVKADVG